MVFHITPPSSFLLSQMVCEFLRDALPASCVLCCGLFIRQPLVREYEFRFLAFGMELYGNKGCFSTSRSRVPGEDQAFRWANLAVLSHVCVVSILVPHDNTELATDPHVELHGR